MQSTPSLQDLLQFYLERLVKLFPSETLMLFSAGKGLLPKEDLPFWVAPTCLVVLLVIRIWGTSAPGQRVQIIGVFVSAVSFVLFVFVSNCDFLWFHLDPKRAEFLMVAWGIIVPIVYKG